MQEWVSYSPLLFFYHSLPLYVLDFQQRLESSAKTELNAYRSEIKSITAQRVFGVAWIYIGRNSKGGQQSPTG
jgi:hypothetical protein